MLETTDRAARYPLCGESPGVRSRYSRTVADRAYQAVKIPEALLAIPDADEDGSG